MHSIQSMFYVKRTMQTTSFLLPSSWVSISYMSSIWSSIIQMLLSKTCVYLINKTNSILDDKRNRQTWTSFHRQHWLFWKSFCIKLQSNITSKMKMTCECLRKSSGKQCLLFTKQTIEVTLMKFEWSWNAPKMKNINFTEQTDGFTQIHKNT